MMGIAEAGQRGERIRSDCWIYLELKDSGGIQIDLTSKVAVMYGRHIRELIIDELKYFGIEHAQIQVHDQGALPWVLMARLETAIKRCLAGVSKNYVPPIRNETRYLSERERFRRTRLYLPGNEPKFMINAGLHQPDGIILDLEDSVAPAEKDTAALLVRNALCQIDFYGAERMVRINQLPQGLVDLEQVVPYHVHVILIPKCESAEQVKQVAEKTDEIRQKYEIEQPVWFMPIIESALGVIKAYEIATASDNTVALTIGLEDYTADLGVQRTPEGRESFWARSQIVNAARAAGIQAIDTVFSDVMDMDGLRKSVLEAKSLGFEGKGCIHPRQIKVIHEAFAPLPEETERAQEIVLAFERAEAEGRSVISLGSKMIDPPVVIRAQRTLKMALMNGQISPDWRQGGTTNDQ